MEMLVDWQPQFGNVESMLVQIAAFLAMSDTRVAASHTPASKQNAERAYERLKQFWSRRWWRRPIWHAAAWHG